MLSVIFLSCERPPKNHFFYTISLGSHCSSCIFSIGAIDRIRSHLKSARGGLVQNRGGREVSRVAGNQGTTSPERAGTKDFSNTAR